MEETITLILQYASIWAPALVAIFSTAASVIFAIAKVKTALTEMTQSKNNLGQKVSQLITENQELNRTNKILIDEITRIKGYADAKAKEE